MPKTRVIFISGEEPVLTWYTHSYPVIRQGDTILLRRRIRSTIPDAKPYPLTKFLVAEITHSFDQCLTSWGVDTEVEVSVRLEPVAALESEQYIAPVQNLNLSTYALNALRRNGILYIECLANAIDNGELLKMYRIGPKTAKEIREALSAYLKKWTPG